MPVSRIHGAPVNLMNELQPTQALPAVLDKIDADLDRSLERLFDF